MSDSVDVTTQNSTVEEWTGALARAVGSPGGGAGAGVMLAMAASLTSMVAGYTEAGDGQQTHVDNVLSRAEELRKLALHLADEDAAASRAFGAAFNLEKGPERDKAIREASVGAARSSAILGEHALEAIDDLGWLAEHGNSALIADVVVAFGALRAALTGARTNVSFDLGTLRASGATLDEVREQHPQLWATVQKLDAAIERIDTSAAAVDDRAAPTDSD
ncbi:cyclodeaminase/cyclohydrolase family protein [Nesterenkonia haasae]|uniref:cyclodeaminase/cyclohydrolase family protein n=1 Tax=Nesterenkonia haasae TaxID=2587813 RepID=UPI0013919B38|nr:cyclodeaminase/cyclohydrolase family protein [Nesterenkonia haasae]NDK31905.1 cyclodeaminase/cyclohydrolase family protein [Nesterenkonia haasae]